jgi:3-oxoadipate enol-lactonase
MEVWADDAAALLAALGIERAHVHGVSMGGAVAMQLAAKYPERVDRLVLNGTYAKNDYAGRLAQDMRIRVAEHMGMDSRALAELIYSQGLSRAALDRADASRVLDFVQDRFERINRREVFLRACRAMRDMDLRACLPRIEAETLVIGGDEDLISPWVMGPTGAGMQYVFEHIANCRRYVVRGSGHSTVSEKTEEYCRVVAAFLAGEPLPEPAEVAAVPATGGAA